MEKLTVTNLGVSALLIQAGNRRILVDAFNSVNQSVEVLPGDLILFTHDDDDHFRAEKLPELKGMDVTIIGPPSIVKPILLQEKADITQLECLFTGDNAVPATISSNDIHIKCYHTTHFNNWDPIHNSYLIEISGKKLYITGDSLLTKELAETIGETDAVVCNLVEEGFLKGYTEGNVAIHHLLSYLLKLKAEGKTEKIIGVHLVNCPWTPDENEINKLIEEYGFQDLILPTSTEQNILLY
jgi:L-ascorbate metabolism protein UlaG (beta-lactamase superfamily)